MEHQIHSMTEKWNAHNVQCISPQLHVHIILYRAKVITMCMYTVLSVWLKSVSEYVSNGRWVPCNTNMDLIRMSILALHWFKYVSLASVLFWTGLDHTGFHTEGSLDFYPNLNYPPPPPIDLKICVDIESLYCALQVSCPVERVNRQSLWSA